MRLTDIELHLICSAVDTHECELIEQENEERDKQEMKALRNLTDKIAKEIRRRADAELNKEKSE